MKTFSLRFSDRLLQAESPLVMGILNLTPDSFFDGGKYADEKAILKHTEKMLQEGADILDVGGYSTRPGAKDVPQEEEERRVLNAIRIILKQFPKTILSVDTFRSSVAAHAIKEGALMINDVSGGNMDSEMYALAGRSHVPYVLMHMQGNPATMQENPQYENVTSDVLHFFTEKILLLRANGVHDIILDPGFGFGKTLDHNYDLLRNLRVFESLACPVLAGLSRKSMVNKILNIKAADALNGTTALNMIALMNGASMLRVHDVKEAVEAIKLHLYYAHNNSVL